MWSHFSTLMKGKGSMDEMLVTEPGFAQFRREQREREKRQADANHWFLSKGTYEEESKFPRAAGRIPHLITILAEWLRPKKSHRKEISLKKAYMHWGEAVPSLTANSAKAVVPYC